MNKIVVGNLKMNLTLNEIKEYVEKMQEINKENVIIFPTNIFIPFFLNKDYNIGIQNICSEDRGSYTGEVSARQTNSLGIKYILVGHSERRKNNNETDKKINKKIKLANKYNLNPILCIGETKKENKLGMTKMVLKKQINNALKDNKLNKIIIAYEPIWSIGTGNIPSKKEIERIILYIKNYVKKIHKIEDVKVLYGGSINKNNIEYIKRIAGLDGVLVGKASTNYSEFIDIINLYLK